MILSASSSLFASATSPVVGIAILTEDEVTTMTTPTMNCVDPTFLYQRTKKKNRRKKSMDLCAWVSSARSKKNNKMKKRCSKTKAGVIVKDQCPCACAEVVTEEDASVSSCPAAGPIFNLLEGNACANIGLTCQYDEIDTSCDQVTSSEICECKSSNANSSGGGVDNHNNARWECESLHLEPCPETPAPSVAPTHQPRRPAQPPSTAAAAITSNEHPTSTFDVSTFAVACMSVVMLAFVVVMVKRRRGEDPRKGYVNIVTHKA